MSSREIAELTGKKHFNVLIDIRSMLDGLQVDHLGFQAMSPDAYGRPQPVFSLPHRETMILLTGSANHQIWRLHQMLRSALLGGSFWVYA